jgi:hypothetical protein
MLLVVAATGCASSKRNLPQEEGLHPRLTPSTYIEDGNLLSLSVDVAAATRREKQSFVPIGIAVGNKNLKALTLNRESFTLVDEQGNRYPLASVQESREQGSLMQSDYKISEYFLEVAATNFNAWTYQPSSFFPVLTADSRYGGGRGTVRDRVELGLRMWTYDILYFPHPKGTLVGNKFELWMTSPDLQEPVFVKFRVK